MRSRGTVIAVGRASAVGGTGTGRVLQLLDLHQDLVVIVVVGAAAVALRSSRHPELAGGRGRACMLVRQVGGLVIKVSQSVDHDLRWASDECLGDGRGAGASGDGVR